MKLLEIEKDLLNLKNSDMGYKQLKKEINMFKCFFKSYKNLKLEDIYKKIDFDSCELKFGSGGNVVHRGYYCPDIYHTFAVGGCNRGKILKRKTSRSKVTRKFYLLDNKIVLTRRYDDIGLYYHVEDVVDVEYIERHGEIEIGLFFNCFSNKKGDLIIVNFCRYDEKGRLQSYRSYYNDEGYLEYTKEIVTYDGDCIQTVDYVHYEPSLGRQLCCNYDTIHFIYDENMEPVNYYHSETYGEINPDHIYNVTKIDKQWYREVIMKK